MVLAMHNMGSLNAAQQIQTDLLCDYAQNYRCRLYDAEIT